jgi:hypothetical protein
MIDWNACLRYKKLDSCEEYQSLYSMQVCCVKCATLEDFGNVKVYMYYKYCNELPVLRNG